VPGAFFLCFVAASLVSLLNLYPQMRGPSVLFERSNRVCGAPLRHRKFYKKSVSGVEIGDVTNPQSGTKILISHFEGYWREAAENNFENTQHPGNLF